MIRVEALSWISKEKLVPVVRAPSAQDAIDLVQALSNSGITIVEITMTVPGAIDVIREVAHRFGSQILVGAGTVTAARSANACIEAGASFVVSPIVDIPTIELCRSENIIVAPGALTPTEIFTAYRAGADVVKVFPCDAVGGAKYLKSIRGPFPQIPMMPTGGVTVENAAEFLSAGAIAVGVGGNLVDLKLLRESPEIFAENAKRFVTTVQGLKPK